MASYQNGIHTPALSGTRWHRELSVLQDWATKVHPTSIGSRHRAYDNGIVSNGRCSTELAANAEEAPGAGVRKHKGEMVSWALFDGMAADTAWGWPWSLGTSPPCICCILYVFCVSFPGLEVKDHCRPGGVVCTVEEAMSVPWTMKSD